jgi:hypothetical protein
MTNSVSDTTPQPDPPATQGRWIVVFIGITLLVGLYLISRVNFSLFHTLLELITVVILAGIFTLTWNVRGYLTNNYLKIVGFCYGAIAVINLFHALTYGGVNLMPGYGANSSIQFWMAEAYLLSITTLIAVLFLGRQTFSDSSIVGCIAGATVILCAAILFGYFPACFIEGTGLTRFKVYSEYALIVVLAISLFLLFQKRAQFDKNVFTIIIASAVLTIIAEFFFSGYTTLFDSANLAGHLFKAAAYCLIYQAIFVTGLKEPFAIVFRTLKQTERELCMHQESLENRIRERTASLEDTNRTLAVEVQERKRAEEARRLSSERLQLATHVARIGIWDWDVVKNELLWDDSMYQLYGIRGGDFGGAYEAWLRTIHPEDKAHIDGEIQAALRGEREYAPEFRIVRGDGAIRYFKADSRTIRDLDGRPQRMIGTNIDITEHKQAAAEIRQLNQELEQRVQLRTAQLETANKELEAFAYSVAHDLRAPLRHIDGFLELLQKGIGNNLDDKHLQYMSNISGAARRMGKLIDDLLAFSRLGRSEMTKVPVDLGILVQEVIQEFEPEMKNRDIRWNIGELTVIPGDRPLLKIVFGNLISNALKYTRFRSQVEISIGRFPSQNAEEIIFVRDNGVGFDMNYSEKLFGVFQRLHREEEFEGTGIGLANVRRIISRHGGKTWAEGKVQEGATFFFSLPTPN